MNYNYIKRYDFIVSQQYDDFTPIKSHSVLLTLADKVHPVCSQVFHYKVPLNHPEATRKARYYDTYMRTW